jgi:hypothetical protein
LAHRGGGYAGDRIHDGARRYDSPAGDASHEQGGDDYDDYNE